MQENIPTDRRPARISVEVGDELHRLLQTEADRRSTPAQRVTIAQVVREILYDRLAAPVG